MSTKNADDSSRYPVSPCAGYFSGTLFEGPFWYPLSGICTNPSSDEIGNGRRRGCLDPKTTRTMLTAHPLRDASNLVLK